MAYQVPRDLLEEWKARRGGGAGRAPSGRRTGQRGLDAEGRGVQRGLEGTGDQGELVATGDNMEW